MIPAESKGALVPAGITDPGYNAVLEPSTGNRLQKKARYCKR
jgi:hypothetical protein